MDMQPVRVPKELQSVRATILEEYVRARLNQFSLGLERKLSATVMPDVFERIVAETYTQLPAPEYCNLPIESRELQLVFRHDCMALGCNDQNCALCQHSAIRRCRVNFDKKYLVGDGLRAKCSAPIRIELLDASTGHVFDDDIGGLEVAMCILDGNRYDIQVSDNNNNTEHELESLQDCCLLTNKRAQPLLVSTAGGGNLPDGRVITRLEKGAVVLPELHVTDSSEALLSGRKPPFRLLAWVIDKENRNLSIRHAVSEGFVVATRRTRTAGKADIPKVDDHVSRLEHMGKETVKKLQDIRSAAESVSISLKLPEGISNCIQRAGEFKHLVQAADQDGTLRQKLQTVLKLSKEKWDEAREHAMRCVVPDNRMRAWYSDRHNHEVGLLFTCRMGIIDMERPVALLRWFGSNEHQNIEATLMAQLTPSQREEVRMFQSQAHQCWYKSAHPGWSLCSYDSEQFLATGNFTQVGNLPGIPVAAPSSPPSPVRRNSCHSVMNPHPLGVVNVYPSSIDVESVLYPGSAVSSAAQAATDHTAHAVLNGVTCAELTPELRPTDASLTQHSINYTKGLASLDIFRMVPQNVVEDRKTPAPSLQLADYRVPQQQVSNHSMAVGFSDLDVFMRTNSFEQGAIFGPMESFPAVHVSTNVQPTKVESLELPDAPDILLRDLSSGFESLRGGRLGRDESLGLESMQSIEQSLDEVQKELDAEIAAEERKKATA